MTKKTAITIAVVILILVCIIAFKLVLYNKLIEESKNDGALLVGKKVTTDSYEVGIYYDNDHYTLNVFTGFIEDAFSFTYDSANFLLDTTSAVFDDAVRKVDGTEVTYQFNLDSNTLYEFNFIPLNNETLKIGNNLDIN